MISVGSCRVVCCVTLKDRIVAGKQNSLAFLV
jgi:hypothetical protein